MNTGPARSQRQRIGRNDPCPCGSGKKYKKCHGTYPQHHHSRLVPEREAFIQKEIAKHKAREFQRQQQQGLGRPIIATEFKGQQFVAVKNRLFYGKWRTFFDFLSDYIKHLLGPEWGTEELSKPEPSRHPLLQMYGLVCKYQPDTILVPGKVHSAPLTGATAAYYGLAYNLYLLDHNVDLQSRLVKRLKNPDQFQGAIYETFVAALFIRAGFDLRFEDETDPTVKHCEFVATSHKTGKSYSVEAKTRAAFKESIDVGNQLYKALAKAALHDRIVFIDVNVPSDRLSSEDQWMTGVASTIKNRESTLTLNGEPAPPAIVIVTNQPFQYELEKVCSGTSAFAEGFKIPDFGTDAASLGLIGAFRARQRHEDIYDLLEHFRAYRIPSTFDGEAPTFAFGEVEQRWQIGKEYDLNSLSENSQATLINASVAVSAGLVYLIFRTQSGSLVTYQDELTPQELQAYSEHPDTFFGSYLKTATAVSTPLDLFKFFYDSYRTCTRAKLLDYLEDSTDPNKFGGMSDDDLLLFFCERNVLAALQTNSTALRNTPGRRSM